MSLRKAAEMALEALDWYVQEDDVIESMAGNEPWVEGKRNAEKAIQTLRQALAQPEQEPVAFYVYKPTLPHGNLGNVSDGDLPWVYDQDPSSGYSARMLVYTAPPKREWVGLTDEEMKKTWYETKNIMGWYSFEEIAQLVEAKLKEKNT